MLGWICLEKKARAIRVFFSRAEVREGGGVKKKGIDKGSEFGASVGILLG